MSTRMDNFVSQIKNHTFINKKTTKENNNQAKTNYTTTPNNAKELRDEFVLQHKKNGLFERLYNKLKNVTNVGLGSKKVEAQIAEFENGKVDKDTVKKTISDYRVSQENSAQAFGDVVAGIAGVSTFYKVKNFGNKLNARFKLNAVPSILSDIPKIDKYVKTVKSVVGSKGKLVAVAAGVAALQAGMFKQWALQVNRIGSKEFKETDAEKNLKAQIKQKKTENAPKTEIKALKKELKALQKQRSKAKRKQEFKNFGTGFINGLLAPVTGLAGGIVGAPTYVAANTGLRYATSQNDNRKKSFSDFAETLKDNAALNTVAALAVAVPAFKKARYNKALVKNLEKVVNDLKDAKLSPLKLESNKTAYNELEDLMLNSSSINNILRSGSPVEEQILKLTDENIFAVKFLQISNGGSPIVKALKENCPPSRTMEDAQKVINNLIGDDKKYTVSKLLGVGTIAESYLAKDASGKEVCIKILKEGIDAAKIQKDKEAFIQLVTKGVPKDKLTQEQNYLIKNINNLADGILKEVDFENEMKAAQKLAKYTKKANVVVPIEAKQGIYVMEKAKGISLDTLVKYNELMFRKKFGYDTAKIDKEIEALKAKSPDFDISELKPDEIKRLLSSYMDVLVEQFNKVDKNGKTLHADIHPGNIFIDIEALKSKKGKLFTLIDTGNTVDISKEQALRSIKLTNYIERANVKDLTKYALDGAILPEGMTPEKANEILESTLKNMFFDNKTQLSKINNEEFLNLTSNIMREHNIIPNDSQLNLNKAQKSAYNSLEGLLNSLLMRKAEGADVHNPMFMMSLLKDTAQIMAKYKSAAKVQEMKNLAKTPIGEVFKQLKNPNMKPTNSVEYLTYHFKQDMPKSYDIA